MTTPSAPFRGASSFWRCAALVLAAVGALSFALACGRMARKAAPARPEAAWSDWNAWQYASARQKPQGAFFVQFRPEGRPEGRTRVAFCVQDDRNYYFLELASEGCYLGVVELGVERTLKSIPSMKLAEVVGRTVVIERQPLRLNVLVDGALAASAAQKDMPAGGVAFGGIGSGLRLQSVRVVPVGEVYFADDFMRTPDDADAWQGVAGDWSIKTLQNPARSINAFSYTGQGRPGLAVTGQPYWSGVNFSAAVRGRNGSVVGLVVAYKGPDDYFMLRWRPRGEDGGARQIVRVKGGAEEILAESPGGYLPAQWYELSFWYGAGWGLVRIDDQTAFRVSHPDLTCGAVGLYVDTPDMDAEKALLEPPVEFDDVLVRSETVFMDDFASDGRAAWVPHGGRWRYLSDGVPWNGATAKRWMLAQAGPETALNVVGDPDWRNQSVSADVGPWTGGTVGLAAAVEAGLNYYSAEWTPAALEIAKTVHGHRTVLASAPVVKPKDQARMELRLDHGRLEVRVDGEKRLAAYDGELRGGQAALLARNTDMARFDNVAVQPIPPLRSVISFHETFAHETSDMVRWSSAAEDWQIAPAKSDENGSSTKLADAVGWHRANVPGDARIELKLPKPLDAGQEVVLLAGGEGGPKDSGYELVLRRALDSEDSSPNAFRLLVFRQGSLAAQGRFSWDSGPETLALVRRGAEVAGLARDREIVLWTDPEPLRGDRVGMASVGAELDINDFNIYTPNVINYTFQDAATDWRVAAGEWDVRNRWECDPRWSFFSGSGDGLVAIWNKRPFQGDLTLEFFAAVQMDRARGGRYDYASDLNATIMGDGKNLNSGYSFVFGGNRNTTTRLFRGDVVLAENPNALIDGRRHHRHWYYIRITRRGNQLEMSVDGKPVLSITDPRPLEGDRIAIWTKDNGMMIGRIRVSADRVGEREAPDVQPPAQLASIYRR